MNNEFDILFLGGLFPKETENEIYKNSKGNIQCAANTFQWALISGLDENLTKPIHIVNSLYIGSFPKRYRKLFIDTYRFSHITNKADDINVGFFNLTGIKAVSRYYATKPYIMQWATQETNLKKVLIAYAMTGTFTNLLKYVKKFNPHVVTCLIIPDLPQYMNLLNNRSLIYNIVKKLELKKIFSNMKYINSYVLLTSYMRDALNINCPSVIVEGIAEDNFHQIEIIDQEKDIKTVLYTGSLYAKYGIINLINAFKQLTGENYRLILCGAGDSEEKINQAMKEDKRIILKGLLKRDEVLRLQKSATVLVNPRQNNEEYTKYSFPSKIMEYLSSGTPVIAYKLDGIPDEYYNYIYTAEESEEGLFNILAEVLEKSENELYEKGMYAREFVLREKNKAIQAKKILNLLNEIRGNENNE